ncbi:LL-diaminopimelate aminotransferase [Paenibacillus sp. MSJ-34]|uniref:LL-diaminopimelate aminotransferase n=1 Tax=Paenibacillus sp. MSJ-34 TaxID=2841529 RepID=UPI001C0F3E5D|nr:LL-diaminopimelate aminotransferase [Paenibacillus sp. MSJ-34]MBU5442338.1 LL-diaminopimelate aminotransferase [Paenibacillus sp. MSJ-34]
METYIQRKFAERIGGEQFGKDTEIYKFEKIKRAKAEAKRKFPDMELLDLGVGEPDEMADEGVVRALAEEAAKQENRFYSDNGIEAFNRAASRYMERVFGVEGLDPATDINHMIGSKSALAMLPSAFIDKGDITLMPSPCYPVLGTHTAYLGGEVFSMPISRDNGFLPDLDAIPQQVLDRAKLLYLNYPNNPTGASATRPFFEQVVAFARRHQLIVVHDAAYAALVFDGAQPLSFLSVPGAKEVGVELHSLSKSFNMTGWRIGFIAGNPLIIKAFATIKDNCDSGQFMAIQKAAIYALEHPDITEGICRKYSRRHRMLADALTELGFRAEKPQGSFFLYTEAPIGIEGGPKFATAEEFSQYLIKEKMISTVPWDDTGRYIRFSVTFGAQGEAEELRVINEMKNRLSGTKLIFA